jgi:hypothetical protein
MEILEREALEYVEACLRLENKVTPPVRIDGDIVREMRPKRCPLTEIEESVVVAERVGTSGRRRAVKGTSEEIPRTHKKSNDE